MSTPRCIARDVFAQVSAMTEDAGVCATSEAGRAKIIEQINLAAQAVVKRIDTEGMLWDFPCPVRQGCFAIPPDCESPRNIFYNGFSLRMRDQWYEGKLAWGRNQYGADCYGQCIDEGQFAIPLPLPKTHSMRVALVAELNGDAGTEVELELINQYGDRVQETLTLAAGGEPVRTTAMAYDVTMVNKPLTQGHVQLQLRYDDGARFQTGTSPYFARYGPKARHAYYRRMKLPGFCGGCQMVVIKGKMKLYPIVSENDILPFDDVHAWRWALAAIDAQTRGDRAAYDDNLAASLRELSRSMQDSDPAGNVAQAKFMSGMGISPSWAGGRGRAWN